MAGEGFLQRFYDASVFVRGDDEDFCAWRSYEVVEKTVAKLVEWLYQSSTGLWRKDLMDFPLLSQESIDNHHLDPVRILQDFHRYVQNALTADENSHPRDNDPVFQAKMNKDSRPPIPKSTKERITLQPWDPKCPAVQLIFWLGEEELVSVDLVPAVQDKVVLSEDWQTNDLARLSDWWDKELGNSQERSRQKGEEVGRVGADIVAKDGFWRFSFANAETAFLRDIDSDGGQ
ncbi:uncharacterized protein [Lepidochelys kempii]|uniref:uncharacterized protein n=1 Tax=Lepidochelys kempii TaxID=8472 RepID=UPI003C6F865F